MARSDLIINLVKASSKGDSDLYRQTLDAIIAEERSKHHHALADKLASFPIEDSKKQIFGSLPSDEISNLIHQKQPNLKLSELYLDPAVLTNLQELIEEHHRVDLLRSYDLEPRHRILLIGPPGNGKTSTAEAVAEALMVPMFIVRYENLIGSYLGETSQRIKNVVDFVRQRRCVLFFDEFDAVSKERGDPHETGEIKRVVNSLLLQLDGLPSHVTLIAASNHSELLDKAVWRRFQVKLELSFPSFSQVKKWFSDFQEQNRIDFKMTAATISKYFEGKSYSELKDFCLDVQRRIILSQPTGNVGQIVAKKLQNTQRIEKPS